MAELDDGFDATEYETSERPDPVPAGRYTLMSDDAGEKVRNSKNTGDLLKFKLKIVDGKHAGRTIYETFNWTNPTETAQQIGRERFASLCKACGKLRPKDTKELEGIPFQAEIIVESFTDKDGNKRTVNKIDSYIEKGSSDKNKKAAKKATSDKQEENAGEDSNNSETEPAWAK